MSDELDRDDVLHNAVELLRQPSEIAPGLAERTRSRRIRQRRSNRMLGASLFVAAIAATTFLVRSSGTGGSSVVFALDAPTVHSVSLVGDFTDWRTDRVKLTRNDDGKWQVAVKLAPGRYRFAYVVDDGEWRADEHAAPVLDDFGRPTSVVTVASW